MRTHLQFLQNQGLYNLHNDVLDFFNKAIAEAVYEQNSLFSDALKNVINDSRLLEDKFKEVFHELNQVGIDKQLIHDILFHNNKIRELLIDTAFPIRTLPTPQYDQVSKKINDLYEFLWRSTINTQTCVNNFGDIILHYKDFDTLNYNRTKRICSFCGIERLKNPIEKRNEYDHYLDKIRYPYSSINFHNLVPMCDACNKSPNKGTSDTLFNTAGERRPAYYPYEEVEIFAVNINCDDIFGNNQSWSTDTNSTSVDSTPAFNTWKVIFNIDFRYALFVQDKCEFWLTNFNAFFEEQTPSDIEQLKARIVAYLEYKNRCAVEVGDFLEKFFWNYFIQIPDNDLLLFIDYLNIRNLVLNT